MDCATSFKKPMRCKENLKKHMYQHEHLNNIIFTFNLLYFRCHCACLTVTWCVAALKVFFKGWFCGVWLEIRPVLPRGGKSPLKHSIALYHESVTTTKCNSFHSFFLCVVNFVICLKPPRPSIALQKLRLFHANLLSTR